MNVAFVDSYFVLALLNPRDGAHQAAAQLGLACDGSMVTTQWVLTEVADALRSPSDRSSFFDYLREVEADPRMKIVPASDELFRRGVDLYSRRLDKAWSLTDCISFVVMQDHGIGDALTGDQHFRQAGFNTLL